MKKTLINLALLITLAASVSTVALAQNVDTDPSLKKEFNAKQVALPAGKKLVWTGTWKYRSRYAPVTLVIKPINSKRIKFEMDASTGGNIGQISGEANVKGNKAFFDDMVPEMNDAEGGFGCHLLFINRGSSIEVKQTSECNQYGGMGVIFEREKLLKGNPPYLEQDFSQRDIFPSPAADEQFKMLVGAADYENLLNSFHLVSEGESADTDTGAKYFIGCVRGVCPYNTGIIMLDGKGKYWAAVNTDVDAETSTVHYYTNDPKWAAKMPAAIAKWAENFSSKVIYKSKK